MGGGGGGVGGVVWRQGAAYLHAVVLPSKASSPFLLPLDRWSLWPHFPFASATAVEQGEYVLRVEGPEGWVFTPAEHSVRLHGG